VVHDRRCLTSKLLNIDTSGREKIRRYVHCRADAPR
jgi:hypothetical protein